MSDDKNIRHRFTVPAADDVVNAWIEKQSNLGFSIRVLIKAFVSNYGYQDATCLEFGMSVRKRGRPPKQAKIRYDQMMEDRETGYMDEYADYDSFDDPVESEPISVPPKSVIPPKKKETERLPAIQQQNDESDSALDILMSSGINKQDDTQSGDTESVQHDDDGFVDPETLFG